MVVGYLGKVHREARPDWVPWDLFFKTEKLRGLGGRFLKPCENNGNFA